MVKKTNLIFQKAFCFFYCNIHRLRRPSDTLVFRKATGCLFFTLAVKQFSSLVYRTLGWENGLQPQI